MTPLEALRSRYLRQPLEVSLETFAFCNADCSFCPYSRLERIGEKLPDMLIARLITEMSQWLEPFHIAPFKVNEPLLDKRLPEICHTIIDTIPRAALRLFTNGSALTGSHIDWIQNLPKRRVDHLWVSLNSTDPAEYTALMKLDFERTAQNLDRLHERVAEYEFTHPVVVSRVLQFGKRTKSNGVRIEDRRDIRFFDDCAKRWPFFVATPIKQDSWIGEIFADESGAALGPCGRWFELSVMANGRVALCCMDSAGTYSLGDVRENSLLEIYNQPAYLERRLRAVNRAGIDPCECCTY